MLRLSHPVIASSLIVLVVPPLASDTIRQTNAQGRVLVIQEQAIVIRQDDALIVYKHFDLKQHRVVRVSLSQGSLPYEVQEGTAAERAAIVDLWRQFGYTATVTDLSGRVTRVCDAYIDFYPPRGRGSLVESIPARTSLPVALSSGGVDEVDFSDIREIDFHGQELGVKLSNGKTKSGKFLMPSSQPAEARFLGITEGYPATSPDVFDFSIPLAQVRTIRFESN